MGVVVLGVASSAVGRRRRYRGRTSASARMRRPSAARRGSGNETVPAVSPGLSRAMRPTGPARDRRRWRPRSSALARSWYMARRLASSAALLGARLEQIAVAGLRRRRTRTGSCPAASAARRAWPAAVASSVHVVGDDALQQLCRILAGDAHDAPVGKPCACPAGCLSCGARSWWRSGRGFARRAPGQRTLSRQAGKRCGAAGDKASLRLGAASGDVSRAANRSGRRGSRGLGGARGLLGRLATCSATTFSSSGGRRCTTFTGVPTSTRLRQIDDVAVEHAEAARRGRPADRLGVVGAVDAVERVAEIQRHGAQRVLDAAGHLLGQAAGRARAFPPADASRARRPCG